MQLHDVQRIELRIRGGKGSRNDGEIFATSLAILKVVREPRVISICLPICTTSINLVGFESRSTMLPASLAACVPEFIATATSACASAGHRWCHRRSSPPAALRLDIGESVPAWPRVSLRPENHLRQLQRQLPLRLGDCHR